MRRIGVCDSCKTEKEIVGRGFCNCCYQKQYIRKTTIVCRICKTEQIHRGKGLCLSCYQKEKYKAFTAKDYKIKKQHDRKFYLKHRDDEIFFFNNRYLSMQSGAKRRNVVFNLTKEEFFKFVSENKNENNKIKCCYCGFEMELKPQRMNNRKNCLSIDRKNNEQGYEINNVVFCCNICNFIKNDLFSYEEMQTIGNMIKKKRIKDSLLTAGFKGQKLVV